MTTTADTEVRTQPISSLLYRGVVESFDQKRGFGFVAIKALIREDSADFDFAWLAPIGDKAMVHFSDILTDSNVRRGDFTLLKAGQMVYFNLDLNAHGKYKCINLKSEFTISSTNTPATGEHFPKRKKVEKDGN